MGKSVRCENVVWDGTRKQLKFANSSSIDPVDVNMSSVKISHPSFDEVVCMEPWARVSTSGHVNMLGEAEANTKRQGKLVQEVVLANDRGQGLKIKIHRTENYRDSLIYLEEHCHVAVSYGKVHFGVGLHLDLEDLSQIACSLPDPLHPQCDIVREVEWPRK